MNVPVSTTSGPPSASFAVAAPRARACRAARSSGFGRRAPEASIPCSVRSTRPESSVAVIRSASFKVSPDVHEPVGIVRAADERLHGTGFGPAVAEAASAGAVQICQSPPRSTGTRSPAAVMPSTSSSGEPIMKSMCVRARRSRGRRARSSTRNGKPLPSAMWLAAFSSSSVLKKTVPSGPMRPCRSTSASSPSRQSAVVDRELRAQRLAVLVGVDLDRVAVLEAHAQAANDRAVAQDERLRRGDVALRPQRVGRREDLFGRQVREVAQAVGASEVGGPPGVRRQHPDRQLRAGPAQLDRVEAPRRRAARPRRSAPPCARPTPAAGSGSSRRSTCSSSLQRRSYASSSSRSGYTSFAHARCGDGTMHQFVERSLTIRVELLHARQHVLADERLVETVEQVRRVGAASVTRAPPSSAMREHPLRRTTRAR